MRRVSSACLLGGAVVSWLGWCSGLRAAGPMENWVIRVLPGNDGEKSVRLVLEVPFTTFFTATERGGSRPSDVLDLFGTGKDSATLRYARIRLR